MIILLGQVKVTSLAYGKTVEFICLTGSNGKPLYLAGVPDIDRSKTGE
ncbi:MAG: hypothetical protein ACFCD0_28265 [Gemmataceae bacterium]